MTGKAPEKLTAAMWPKPRDSSIHADLTVDAGPLRSFLGAVRNAGYRITPTALIVQAIGRILVEYPDVNRDVRGGRLRDRKEVDAWVTMTDDEGRLLGHRIDKLDERNLIETQAQITETGKAHKEQASLTGRGIHALVRWLPLFLLRWIMRFVEFLVHGLRIPVGLLGVNREGFGAVHITNVGPFGIQHVATPIPPITGQGILLAVGEIHEAPVVNNGEVQAGLKLPIMATLDHRIIVGIKAATWAKRFQALLKDTDWMLDQLPEQVRKEVEAELESR